MKSRLAVYDIAAQTFQGYLPTTSLSFSTEVGGDGTITFECLKSDADATSVWRSTVIVELETSTGWVNGPMFAIRNDWTHVGGFRRYKFTGRGLLATWASETLVFPESGATIDATTGSSVILQGSGDERGLGWMMTAYLYRSDPDDPWNQAITVDRGTYTTDDISFELESDGWVVGALYESLKDGTTIDGTTYDKGDNFTATSTKHTINSDGEVGRIKKVWPDNWPAKNSKWVTCSGMSDETEGKYFRETITVPAGGPQTVQFFLSSDEDSTLWVAGERVIERSQDETGWQNFDEQKVVMMPGTYAIGVYSPSSRTKNAGAGAGEDPIMLAVALLDAKGKRVSWLLLSDAGEGNEFRGTRRDNVEPDNIPPGPTPGRVLHTLIWEAGLRNVVGWSNVSLGFTDTHDSNNVAWNDIEERNVRIGVDTYHDLFQQWGETDEMDVWLVNTGTGTTPNLVLRAAKRQGKALGWTWTNTHFSNFNTSGANGSGTYVVTRSHKGWLTRSISGPRREYSLELGTALSKPMTRRVADASLRDSWRWDSFGKMNPPQTGWIPFVNFDLGDWTDVSYQAISHNLSVTSISAVAGEGGLLFEVEFTEYPNDGDET